MRTKLTLTDDNLGFDIRQLEVCFDQDKSIVVWNFDLKDA